MGLVDLEEKLGDSQIQGRFHSLGIKSDDAWTLFKLMDVDKSSFIEWEEFLKGCMQLSGTASAMDVAKMTSNHKWVMRKLDSIIKTLDMIKIHDSKPGGIQTSDNRPSVDRV